MTDTEDVPDRPPVRLVSSGSGGDYLSFADSLKTRGGEKGDGEGEKKIHRV